MYRNIEMQRIKKGLTIPQLLRKLGITRGTYYLWLRNGNIPADKLIAMSHLLGCSIDYLLGLKGTDK